MILNRDGVLYIAACVGALRWGQRYPARGEPSSLRCSGQLQYDELAAFV
jgi:hypothetical protein